ncbi:hypothetical protein [Streptomyces sp. NPDC097619]|uniref:hypothetical protein n=1 Tax=Streptomyces sp. NPDC097619 TaxID=3157228 RepID=UPI003319289A
MITEPELDGEHAAFRRPREDDTPGPAPDRLAAGGPAPGGGVPEGADFGPGAAEDPAVGGPRRRPGGGRPWLWTLAGALIASAAWGGSLYLTGAGQERAPELPYRAPSDLCEELKAPSLTRMLGGLRAGPSHQDVPHEAVDWFGCVLSGEDRAGSDGNWQLNRELRVTLTLHKKTDPEAEFGADLPTVSAGADSDVTREAVAGLGERAQFVTLNGADAPLLRVLDGGAEFTMQPGSTLNYRDQEGEGEQQEEPPLDPVEPEALKEAMVTDMRALMARLRKD